MTTRQMRKKVMRRRKRLVKLGLANLRGPESVVTLAMVERIGKRFSVGVPLKFCLAMERAEVSLDTFHKSIQTRAKLSTRWHAAHGKFLLAACQQILKGKGDTIGARWILTRRWPEFFTTADERGDHPATAPDKTREDLQRIINDARELARQRMEVNAEKQNASDQRPGPR